MLLETLEIRIRLNIHDGNDDNNNEEIIEQVSKLRRTNKNIQGLQQTTPQKIKGAITLAN